MSGAAGNYGESLMGLQATPFNILAGCFTTDAALATLGLASTSAVSFGSVNVNSISVSNTNITQLTNPVAPTVTNVGTAGSTTVTYGIVAVLADGTTSGLGVTTANATSNATLNGTNYNTVTWSLITGAAHYQIWRIATGGTPNTTGLIGTVGAGVTTFNDTGIVANGATAPIFNNTGVFYMNGAPVIQFANGWRGTTFTPDPENTFIGYNAGGGTSTGQGCIENTAVGYQAGGGGGVVPVGVTGNRNTSIGYIALGSITTGSRNTALGNNVLCSETSASNNTVVGSDACRFTIGTTQVDALGAQAAYNTVLSNSIAIGFFAFGPSAPAGSTGSFNVAISQNAFNSTSLVNPTYNVIVGNAVFGGTATVSPFSNVVVGNNIGAAAVSPQSNTLIGHGAGGGITTGNSNVAMGHFALRVITSGGNNVAFGESAGNKITTGASNVVVGPLVASTTLVTGSGNIYLGAGAAIDAATAAESNTFRLGNNATNLVRATGINTATPAFFLDWLPTSTSYASDTLAAAGGIAVGQLYRNGSIVQCRIT